MSKLCATCLPNTPWACTTTNSVKFGANAPPPFQDQRSAQGGWAYTPNFMVHVTVHCVMGISSSQPIHKILPRLKCLLHHKMFKICLKRTIIVVAYIAGSFSAYGTGDICTPWTYWPTYILSARNKNSILVLCFGAFSSFWTGIKMQIAEQPRSRKIGTVPLFATVKSVCTTTQQHVLWLVVLGHVPKQGESAN